ncbi:MAG: GTP cyclohydrolase IIa [Thermoproteota archaeon]|nr:GTP cyclohydrolase IIa [Thermoproteota archaeon]
MMNIQLTIIKIEGYGPWTLTLGSDREAELQMLQADIYHDLQNLFSKYNCLVFFNTFDEYFVITNTLTLQNHISIIKEISQKNPDLCISFTIGNGKTPLDANINAYQARKNDKFLDEEFRIYGEINNTVYMSSTSLNDKKIKTLHIDINGSSGIGNYISPYETTVKVMKSYVLLMDKFLKKNSLTFFLGGDNFMIIAADLIDKDEISCLLNSISDELDIKFNCGIGFGKTSRESAKNATEALDLIRKLRKKGQIIPIYEIK